VECTLDGADKTGVMRVKDGLSNQMNIAAIEEVEKEDDQ
jgi:hypothetical protein